MYYYHTSQYANIYYPKKEKRGTGVYSYFHSFCNVLHMHIDMSMVNPIKPESQHKDIHVIV